MAKLKTVAGSGYGSVYLDALINGGPIWDVSSEPIHFLWGNPEDRIASSAAHSDRPNPYLGEDGLSSRWPNATTWGEATEYWPDERSPIVAAVEQFEAVSGIRFDLAQNWTVADMAVWKTAWLPTDVWSESERPEYKDVASGENKQSWLYLDTQKGAGEDGSDVGSWANPHPGGFGFHVILQMLGLAVGLAHTHDGGDYADRTTFPGLSGKYDIGAEGLNQVPFTVMSSNYNLKGYEQNQGKWGSMKTLGAFDIAALQKLYGVNTETAKGDDVYELPTKNERFGGWYDVVAPGWSCIWDAGGTDTISGQNSVTGVTIDLRAATLIDHDPHAGGYISQQAGIAGGFTIANGVIVENATGGFGNDTLIGNDANNVLNGGGGADVMSGGAGNDTYYVDNENDQINDTSGINNIIATTSYILNGVRATGSGVVDNDAVIVTGTKKNDTVIGNAKDNKLYGGLGKDTLTGGAGKDFFVFNTKASKKNLDTITDFSVKDDTIWLDNKYFTKLGKKGSEKKPAKLNKKFFTIGEKAKDADDYVIYSKKKGVLYYDQDGSGSKKAIEIAKLDKKLKMTYKDFFIV